VAAPEEGTSAVSFVGRDRELARAVGLLDEARAGRGRLLLCTGEAGIGKTRFAEEIAAAAGARDVAVVWARSTDRDSSPPYGLWRLALEELPDDRRGEPVATAGLDLWSLVFGASESRAVGIGSELDRAQRFALFGEVRQQLARAAEKSGLLLVLDDVQWADEPSLLLLAYLVRQLRGLRMLVVATCREPTPPGDRSSETIGALLADTETERVELTGLQADAIRELLASAGQAASRQQADAVRAETGGNPFLIREVVRMRAEQPDAAPGTVPGTVLHATSYRIAQLGPRSQDVLRAAAVAGTSFSVGVVALMLGAAVLSLLDPVDECQAAGFLVAGDHAGEYRFSHALVRSAVVAQLSASDQLRWHNAAADAIERFYSGQLRSHLAELAYHRVRGSLPGDRIRAARACEAAGDVAAEDLAFEEAARLYRQALSAGQGELSEADRGRLELAVAGALYRSGDLPGWHDAVAGVARRAERRGDHLLLARAGLEMEATSFPEWDSEICRVCEQALAGPELDAALRARVLARHARALVYRGEYERAAAVSRAALDAADADGSPAAVMDALHARQLASGGPDGTSERAAVAARMLEVAGAARDAWAEMWGRLWRIDTRFETGQLAVISRELADLAVCAGRAHGPLARWHLLQYSAAHAHATGRYAEAVRLADEAYTVITDMGHPAAFGSYAMILCPVGMHIGFQAAGATGLLAQLPAPGGPDAGDGGSVPALSLALMWLDQGDRDRAAQAYGQAGPVRSWRLYPPLRLIGWAVGLAVAIALDQADDIAYLAERFEPLRGRHVANSAGAGGYLGPVELHLGKAAAALGSVEAAAADLETAAGTCDAIGAQGFAVEACVELAAALARRGTRADRDRALTVLARAAPDAGRLGMTPFTGRIADLRGRLRGAAPAPSLLSPREQEVARLVGRGLTNRQIAEALYVSERTAQNHVQHILVKLGFSNRSQIAAWSSTSPAPAAPVPPAG
jgi:DNA-binding CsgD family transcriptional regulator/tetratricopeptide (TPR) repeat protein